MLLIILSICTICLVNKDKKMLAIFQLFKKSKIEFIVVAINMPIYLHII